MTKKKFFSDRVFISKDYAKSCKIVTFVSEAFIWRHDQNVADYEEVSKEDKENILKMVKSERSKFLKRLNMYLKRYGLSKIRAWSYWRDR